MLSAIKSNLLKKISLLLATTLVVFALAACGEEAATSQPATQAQPTEPPATVAPVDPTHRTDYHHM